MMRVCLMIEGQEGVTWEQWLALALAAEASGLDAAEKDPDVVPGQSLQRGQVPLLQICSSPLR